MTNTELNEFLRAPEKCEDLRLYEATDINWIIFEEALKRATNLSYLYICLSNLGDQEALHIAQGLAENSTLIRLDLSQNEIGDEGVTAISFTATNIPTLVRLSLHNNQIGDKGATAIGEAFASHTKLSELYLSHNQIGTNGAAEILGVFAGRESLGSITLNNNKIEYYLIDQLKVSHPNEHRIILSDQNPEMDNGTLPISDELTYDSDSSDLDQASEGNAVLDRAKKCAEAFVAEGKYPEAIESYKIINDFFHINKCFKAWLAKDEENPEIWLQRGDYCLEIGLREKALKYYGNACGLSRDEDFKEAAMHKMVEALTPPTQELAEQLHANAESHNLYNLELADDELLAEQSEDDDVVEHAHNNGDYSSPATEDTPPEIREWLPFLGDENDTEGFSAE